MKNSPFESTVPPNSRIASLLEGASFHDSWCVTSSDTSLSALGHFIATAKQTPRWIDMCMTARNRIGRIVGLKDLGTLSEVVNGKPASAYQPGERVGIFTIIENTFDEALIGDEDKHLNVVLSIHRKKHLDGKLVSITVTTVVHVKNMLGSIYMLPVKPMHRLITPAVLTSIGRKAHAA
ncbi:DUF2867 domain-containing protein [Simplicispira piscis]